METSDLLDTFTFAPNRSKPMYAQVKDTLRNLIQQRFTDGELFYTEKQLVERLPVSQITVRRALKDLSSEGLLLRRRGIGTVVTSPETRPAVRPVGDGAPPRQTTSILAPDWTSEYVNALMNEISKLCSERDIKVQTYRTPPGDRALEVVNEIVLSSEETAFMLMTTSDASLATFLGLSEQGYRTVAFEGAGPNHPGLAVRTDAAAAMRIGLEHLRKLGHERITLLVNEPLSEYSVIAKVEEYRSMMQRKGLKDVAQVVVCGTHLFENSYAAAYSHMSEVWDVPEGERPTAIFTVSDPGGWAAMKWLAERGVSVPGEVSVLGFEDAYSSQFMHPSLSSVAHPIKLLAQRAMDLLWGTPKAQPYHELLSPILMARESTGPVQQTRRSDAPTPARQSAKREPIAPPQAHF